MEPIVEERDGVFYASTVCCGLNVTAEDDTEQAALGLLAVKVMHVESIDTEGGEDE